MQASDSSFAKKFFGKSRDKLTIQDFWRVIGQRGGPEVVMRKLRGRQIFLYAFKIPAIWNALTLSDFIGFVPALQGVPLDKLDSPYELYRLATLANTISHAINEMAGVYLPEGYEAFQVKGLALAKLIESFGDDIDVTEDHDVSGTYLSIRLHSPHTQGLHIKRRSLDLIVQQAAN